MKIFEIIICDFFAVNPGDIKPPAYRILIMACSSCHSANTSLLWEQCKSPKYFIGRRVQSKKGCTSALTETMSTGFAAKKRCIYLTVSLLENDVPQTLRAIVRTVFVPTPQFRCVVFFLRSYPSRQRIDLITYKSIQSTADTTRYRYQLLLAFDSSRITTLGAVIFNEITNRKRLSVIINKNYSIYSSDPYLLAYTLPSSYVT